MSTLITKQHLKLIDEIRVGDRSMRFDITDARAAQLIAESEANATAELRLDRYRAVKGRHEAEHERDQLRAECNNLRADLDAIKAIRNEETARAERAEAEVKKLTGFYNEIVVECGHDRIVREYRQRGELLRDEANRRKEAEAELANIRALANRRNKRDHAQDTTHQLVAALDQALDIAQAELAATKSTLDEEVNCAEKAEHEVVRQYARAERAEAELHALRLICGTTDADKFSTWVDRANTRAEKAEREVERLRSETRRVGRNGAEECIRAERAEAELNASRYETVKAAQDGLRECIRAERAEAELKAYRDAVDAQPWATDEPIRVMLDRVTMLWASEKQAKVERGDMLCECQAELAAERARLDWLEKVDPTSPQWDIICDHVNIRDAIDAAMKEDRT